MCGIKALALFRWRGTSVYLPIKWDSFSFHQLLTTLLSLVWVQLLLTGGWGEKGMEPRNSKGGLRTVLKTIPCSNWPASGIS